MFIAKILHANVVRIVVHSNFVNLYARNKFLSDTNRLKKTLLNYPRQVMRKNNFVPIVIALVLSKFSTKTYQFLFIFQDQSMKMIDLIQSDSYLSTLRQTNIKFHLQEVKRNITSGKSY